LARRSIFGLIGQYWLGGGAVVAVLMLVARPATVFLCATPDRRARWSFNEMLFMCWTRETGVIPAALAGLLLGMKAPGAQMIASVTFIAILMTILIQAPSTEWLGRRLGLLENEKSADRFGGGLQMPNGNRVSTALLICILSQQPEPASSIRLMAPGSGSSSDGDEGDDAIICAPGAFMPIAGPPMPAE